MAFGIPTSEHGFRKSLDSGTTGFAAGFRGGWYQYQSLLVNDFSIVAPYFLKRGVTIMTDATLGDFAGLLRRFDVVVLFSHWGGDSVEFSDGFQPVSAIVDAVPVSWSGLIDLCVCHPLSLVSELRRSRPRCLVKSVRSAASPDIWLHFYRILFAQLSTRELTYLEGLEEVICEFVRFCGMKDIRNDPA